MSNKRAKENRRQIRKEFNRIYDTAFTGFMAEYNELNLWQKIKLAFKTEKMKKRGNKNV